MKRITSAALAATMSLAVLAAPAYAAEGEENTGSSEAYQDCLKGQKDAKKYIESAPNEKEKERRQKKVDESLKAVGIGSSTDSGVCIKAMTHEDSKYRSSALGVLIGVPLALVAVLGAAAAAASGMIPGVSIPGLSLPAMPNLPM